MRWIWFNLLAIFLGWILFTFFSVNVIPRFGGGKFADFNDSLVQFGINEIPGFKYLEEYGYVDWLRKFDNAKFSNYTHERVFNEMVAINETYKSKNIKEIMTSLSIDYFDKLNIITDKISFGQGADTATKKITDKTIKLTIETIELIRSNQKGLEDNVLTLTCSGNDKVFNFAFIDNKAILTKAKSYKGFFKKDLEAQILGGWYYKPEDSEYSFAYLTNLSKDKASTNTRLQYLNHWYVFFISKTNYRKTKYRLLEYKKGTEMGQIPKSDKSEKTNTLYCV